MTAISKNVYFDVLDLLINTITQFIEALKWNQLTLRLIPMLNAMKINMKNILNSKLVITLEFPNTETFLLKDTIKIGQKKFSLLVKLKIQFCGKTWLVTWLVNQLLEVFMKKNCKKQIEKNLQYKNWLKEKVINCTSNGKGVIVVLIIGLIKKTSYKNE